MALGLRDPIIILFIIDCIQNQLPIGIVILLALLVNLFLPAGFVGVYDA